MNTDDKINRLELRIHRLEQEAAYRLRRLERTLGTLISWLLIELGSNNTQTLLDMLSAPENPNCLEGPGRTPEEVAQNARELDAVAPTPADKFALMFGDLKSGEPWEEWLSRQREKFAAIDRELETARKERDEARSLVAAFEKEVNEGFNRTVESEKQHADAAISDVNYIFRLHKELRERVEKVIGGWRDSDWFRKGSGRTHPEIVVGVNEAEAIKLLKYLKP